ncbi:MAG: thiolase family protein [Actinoallomurus sp.]
MTEAVVIDVVRTPLAKGRPGGALHETHPAGLLASTLADLVGRTGIDPALIDDVIAGCVAQAGEQAKNIARNAALTAGFPESVPGVTVDRQCGSSQQALHFAVQGVLSGAYDVVVACGVESMSRVPMRTALMGQDPYGPGLAARYGGGLVHQGISAELVAARWKIAREELDAYAAESHRRAAHATRQGWFAGDLVPNGGSVDASIRPDTTTERLAELPPAFYDEAAARRFPEIGWRVTAGNSSTVNDGAAAALITSEAAARRYGLRPRARFRAGTATGDDPLLMLTAVIPATRKVLDRAGLTSADIGVFEVNEAFASVVLAWQRETGVDLDRVNVAGGAIALGHPLGASGTRLLSSLLGSMERRDARFGLQAMCEAGGLANATVLELCH